MKLWSFYSTFMRSEHLHLFYWMNLCHIRCEASIVTYKGLMRRRRTLWLMKKSLRYLLSATGPFIPCKRPHANYKCLHLFSNLSVHSILSRRHSLVNWLHFKVNQWDWDFVQWHEEHFCLRENSWTIVSMLQARSLCLQFLFYSAVHSLNSVNSYEITSPLVTCFSFLSRCSFIL